MPTLKHVACSAALALTALAATGSAQASVLMTDWVFNPNGGGFEQGQLVGEYLDTNGKAFIQLSPYGEGSFTFTEHAVFNLLQADGSGRTFSSAFPGGNITATLQASGRGDFNGAFRFEAGTIRMYQNPVKGQYASTNGIYGANLGKLIAEFDVLAGGGGRVDANGSPLNNGQVTVHAAAAAGKLAAGYFFNGDGVDLSTQPTFAFAFSNANTLGNPNSPATPNLVKELACEFAGFTGSGCSGTTRYRNVNGKHFFINANGQFKLGEVPEPGSVALFGIALAGIGALRRRARKA